ncbi:MAG: hypothetical protein K9K76_10145 [Halanaerobiales bacterium]|nr:hypothetical protein [Halanaerobiales bacterium]
MTDETKHILRYGTHADKKFIDNKDFYFDWLAFNGNMVAFTPGAIAEFIMQNLLKSDNSKGFFIDPITHAFQHDLSKIKSYSKKEKKETIKLSIEKLINFYGEPVKNAILDKDISIVPSDFKSNNSIDVKLVKNFSENVIKFQLDVTIDKLKEKGYLDYIEDGSELISNLEPEFLIPPYFYMTESTYEDWLPINLEMLKAVKEKYTHKKVYAQIVVSKDIFMAPEFLKKVKTRYAEINPDGILLWIDDFNEHEVSKSFLIQYAKLVKYFCNHNIEVINLYGGYFSILLTGFYEENNFKLHGVGHGLEYGEHRSVVPVGGGIPTSKYYYYPLHNRLKYREATELLIEKGILDNKDISNKEAAEMYFEEICDQKICKDEIIKEDIDNFKEFESTEFFEVEIKGYKQRRRYADRQTRRVCLLHYLLNKNKEFREVKSIDLDDEIQRLRKSYNEYLELNVLSWESLIYLKNWFEALESLKVNN